MRKTLLRFCFASAFLVLVGNQLHADVVSTVNFNAPTYSDGALIGQDSWLITGTSVVNPVMVANTGTNGNVTLTTTGQDANRPFAPVAAIDLISIDLTADILVSAAQATGDYFLHLGDGGTSNFYARIYARTGVGANTFQLAMGTSSGAAVTYGADLDLNTLFTINARYDVVAGLLNDSGQLFVNGNPYIAATTIGTDATTFGSVNLRQGTAGNAPTVTVDNLIVNTTAAAIPEPSSFALIGLVATCLMTRRRK